jgi:hypothetical protein
MSPLASTRLKPYTYSIPSSQISSPNECGPRGGYFGGLVTPRFHNLRRADNFRVPIHPHLPFQDGDHSWDTL